MLFSLSACDLIEELIGESKRGKGHDESDRHVQLSLAVAHHIAWMPWYYADQEGILSENSVRHQLEVQFIKDDYQNLIESFLNDEVQAIVISNIAAIAQLVRRDIESDVILITNDSSGNEAILLPEQANAKVHELPGKSFALVKYSTRHYLLDRYLIRNQVPIEEIKIINIAETDVLNAFLNKEIYGVVSRNPYLYKLTHQDPAAKILFDSRQIPKEIFDLLVVRRETLIDYPKFAQVLLATWFSVMERLQGSKKGPTMDAMAGLAGLSRQELDEQLITTPLNDTPTKALSAIRDRRIRKTMRHIRYFIDRYELSGSELFNESISYPGRTPALLHFNGQPLQDFVMPALTKK
jgi:NitT/TauT family transport system substrate-binding protein